MSSKSRYSIDEPIGLDDLNGEGPVYNNTPVTEGDRELLEADEVALDGDRDYNKKQQKKSAFASKAKSFLPKKKVQFGGEYSRLSDQQQRKPQPIFANDYDSEDESDSDIEVDLEAKSGRRRRNQAFRRKLHFFLFLVFLLGGLLFLSNILQPDEKSGGRRIDHQTTNKKTMSNGTHDFNPTTVMVSLDGFHPHYINQDLTPNLHELLTKKSGVPYMKPSFPTSTFPNHWTLVTGLYPGNHGIVGNTFYDIKNERQFVNTKPDKSLQLFWWGGEPLWNTLSRQNIDTAIHMWPGSEAPWEPKPMQVDKYNGTERLGRKSERVMEWLDQDIDHRPELVLVYVPTVDQVGHKYGVHGKDLKESLQSVDKFIGSLRNGLKDRHLTDIVNLMVVSDHGMAPTSDDRLVFLDDLVDLDQIEHVDGWPLQAIRPKEGASVEKLYQSLKNQENEGWNVFTAANLPQQWHFGARSKFSYRIAPLWIVPQVGWAITTHKDLDDMGGNYQPHGVHGYNNSEVLMRATFVAEGAYFDDQLYKPIDNVDIYNIVCDTLNANPAPNDGRPTGKSLQKLDKWHDTQGYPGVEFTADILKINSTVEAMFKKTSHNKAGLTNTRHGFSDTTRHAYKSVKGWMFGDD